MTALANVLPLLLTAEQAAAYLNMSERHFNRLVKAGEIPARVQSTLTYGHTRCRKYSRVMLERFAAGELSP